MIYTGCFIGILIENNKFEEEIKKSVIEEREKEMISAKEQDNVETAFNYNIDKCFLKFKSIGRKKNGSTYSEWKAEVEKQIKDAKVEDVQNLIKQVEIKKAQLERSNEFFNLFDFLSANIPILTVFLTVMVALYVPINNDLVNIQLASYSTEEIREFGNELANIINDNYWTFGKRIRDCCSIILVLNTIVWIFSGRISSCRAKKLSYYTFLIKVLRKEDDKQSQFVYLSRQEVAFLRKRRKIEGCRSLKEDFYTKFKPKK